MSIERRDHIEKALVFIQLIQKNKYVTADRVAEELGVCRSSAHKWIKAASLVMPIYECGVVTTGGRGRNIIKYAIL